MGLVHVGAQVSRWGGRRDTARLGAVTLEALGLVLDPFERTLRPKRTRLAALG